MRAAVAVVAAMLLAGCASTPVSERDAASPEPLGAHLRTEQFVFDPVVGDVEGTEVCDGRPGRDVLATFDRAAWPELGVERGEAQMTCGNADGAGWRHIADGHTGDFQELADLVDSSWEDVAWFAIDAALESPTAVEEYRDDIVNYDVLVEYVDASGDVDRSWLVTVGYGQGSGQIITSFPDEQ